MNLENKQQSSATSPKRRWLKVFGVMIVMLILGCVIAWKMLLYTPGQYAPTVPADPDQVSTYLTHKLAPDFYNNIQLDTPFWMLVEQVGLNDIIATSSDWPVDAGGAVVSTPSVSLTPGTIKGMAKINFGKFPVVTTVAIKPEIDDNGLLKLNLQHVKAGAINITPMAKALIIKLIDDELNAAPEDFDYGWLRGVRAAVVDNTPFDPAFTLNENTIRVTEFELTDQKMKVLLTPSE